MMASKGWKVIQAHIPMIRFRKGGINRAVGGTVPPPSAAAGVAQQKSAGGASGPQVIRRPTIEDFQLPLRYQRRPIDPKEIEYINRGGPE